MPVETTDKYHRIRIHNPSVFETGSFRTITIGQASDKIKAIIGKPKGSTKTTVQVFLFNVDKWTLAAAKKWVKDHKKNNKNFEDFTLNKSILNIGKEAGHFEFFMPFDKEQRDGRDFVKVVEKDGKKFIRGEASNTKRDKDGERMSSNFIKKMQDTAIGKPIFVSHKTEVENTIGYISAVDGDKDSFCIEAALEPEYNKGTGEGNEKVNMVLEKITHGTPLGYSVGGRVTKAYKELDTTNGQTTTVFDDGEINHTGVVAIPAAFVSPLSVMVKSLNIGGEIVRAGDYEKEVSHEELRDKLRKLAESLFPKKGDGIHVDIYLEQIYDNHFVVRDWENSKYYDIEYKMTDEEPELITGEKTEVEQKFVPVGKEFNDELFNEAFDVIAKDKLISAFKKLKEEIKKGNNEKALADYTEFANGLCKEVEDYIIIKTIN